jgi:hypothetical protein
MLPRRGALALLVALCATLPSTSQAQIKAQFLGSPPNVDERLIKDYARPGLAEGGATLIYQIELIVPITKGLSTLQGALSANKVNATHTAVLNNIPTDRQSPRVLNVLAAAFAAVAANPGLSPDVDHELIVDYAHPGSGANGPRRSYRIKRDIPIKNSDWSNLEASVAAGNSQRTYDIVYANVEPTKRSAVLTNFLKAALELK